MPEKRLSSSGAFDVAATLLVAYGASRENAKIVAEHLVDAERVGLASHGFLRLPQYIDEILAGEIDPAAVPVDQDHGSRIDIDGRRGFGQVAGARAVSHGIRLAQERGVGVVTVRQSGHAGRVGAYAERFGEEGFISVIFCSGPKSGHRVAPFNGREGRLATNPIAFSVPTSDYPIVGDFSTAAAPEGRIRLLRDLGLEASSETLLGPDGTPTIDPNVLYSVPPGTIMPFGGERLGHRGFALALLVESLATVFVGDDSADSSRIGNNLAIIVIAVGPEFRQRADGMAQYVLSSAPRGDKPVQLPGTIERERRLMTNEVVLSKATWQAIRDRARRAGVAVDEGSSWGPGLS
jgi:LDH2 family malate/lactate/ureidoglycolate dehydrogenase